MAGCCRAAVCEEIFGPRSARKTLQHYRKKGLGNIERQMLASIPTEDLAHASVLEIGGGIGAFQAEVIAKGADHGEIVELIAAYEPFARELVREKGLESRSRFRVADILEQPASVTSATIVVLNRVVCCSPDGVRLAELAAHLAERVLILSFPRDRFVVRTGGAIVNTAQRLFRRSFRVFLHPKASLMSAAHSSGLRLAGHGQTFAWEFMAFHHVQPHDTDGQ